MDWTIDLGCFSRGISFVLLLGMWRLVLRYQDRMKIRKDMWVVFSYFVWFLCLWDVTSSKWNFIFINCLYFHFSVLKPWILAYGFSYSGQAHGRWEILQDLGIQRLQMGCGHIGTFLFPCQNKNHLYLVHLSPFFLIKRLTGSCLLILAMIHVMLALFPIKRTQMG